MTFTSKHDETPTIITIAAPKKMRNRVVSNNFEILQNFGNEAGWDESHALLGGHDQRQGQTWQTPGS